MGASIYDFLTAARTETVSTIGFVKLNLVKPLMVERYNTLDVWMRKRRKKWRFYGGSRKISAKKRGFIFEAMPRPSETPFVMGSLADLPIRKKQGKHGEALALCP